MRRGAYLEWVVREAGANLYCFLWSVFVAPPLDCRRSFVFILPSSFRHSLLPVANSSMHNQPYFPALHFTFSVVYTDRAPRTCTFSYSFLLSTSLSSLSSLSSPRICCESHFNSIVCIESYNSNESVASRECSSAPSLCDLIREL